jgi:orotate phosphoribosyltransferase
MSFTDNDRARLLALITEKSFNQAEEGASFTLASGATSTWYFDMKPSLLDPEGAALIANAILERLEGMEFHAIGGMAVGGIPIVSAVCALSWPARPIPAFFVRKDVKERGLARAVEGNIAQNSRVVLVEDVTTTGGSVLRAVDAVEALGCTVVVVITLVDRLEGARDALKARNIPLDALYTRDEFIAAGA